MSTVDHAVHEMYAAVADLQEAIVQAQTVSEALRLRHRIETVIDELNTVAVAALARADALCDKG